VLTEDDIGNLWERMAKVYGHKWTGTFGDCDDGTWLAGLSDLTPSDMARGITEMFKQNLPWPPNLMEFRAMAKPNTPAYHKPFPKLLDAPRNPEVAESAIAKLKAIVHPRDEHLDGEEPA